MRARAEALRGSFLDARKARARRLRGLAKATLGLAAIFCLAFVALWATATASLSVTPLLVSIGLAAGGFVLAAVMVSLLARSAAPVARAPAPDPTHDSPERGHQPPDLETE